MNSPRPKAEAVQEMRVFGNTYKVPHRLRKINVNISDLVRDYPIVSAHWFGLTGDIELLEDMGGV